MVSAYTAPGYVVLGRYSPPQALDSHHQHISIDLSIPNTISLEYRHVTHADDHGLFFTFMSDTSTSIFASKQPFTVQMLNSRGDPRSRYMVSIVDAVYKIVMSCMQIGRTNLPWGEGAMEGRHSCTGVIHLTPHTSHLTPHTSHVTPQGIHNAPEIVWQRKRCYRHSDPSHSFTFSSETLAHITRHTSHVTHHTSHVNCVGS
jgi:hypothetical protein